MDTNNDQPVFTGIDAALDFMEQKESDSVATTTDTKEEETLEEESEVNEDETEEDESETEDSNEQPEDDEESDADETEDEDDDEVVNFKFMDGDEEITVTDVEEVKKGYLRQSQFTKVTQELAVERKEVAKEKGDNLELKTQLLTSIGEFKAASSDKLAKFMNVDWEVLQKSDPIEFDELKSEFEAAKMAYEQSSQKEQEVSNELTAETIEYAQGVRAEEMIKLANALPEVNNEDSVLMDDATRHGMETYGFSEKELHSIYDHRQIRVLIDAARFNESQDKLKTGKAKSKTVKKSIKSKGSVSKATAKARKAKATKKALEQPGGVTLDEAMRFLNG